MKTVTLANILQEPKKILTLLKQGKLLIYPTDTVYGIGCDATNFESVAKLRKTKNRPTKPLSIIAPSKEWIINNLECDIRDLDFLPGKITLIFRKNNTNCVAKNVSNAKLGVRILNHPLQEVFTKYGKPVITTSANVSGKETITSINTIPDELRHKTSLFINQEVLDSKASKIIDMTTKEVLR